MHLSLLHQKTITKLMLAYCVTTVHEVKISKYFKQHVHCLVNCIIQTEARKQSRAGGQHHEQGHLIWGKEEPPFFNKSIIEKIVSCGAKRIVHLRFWNYYI